jgi:dCMP deaminase
MQNNYFNKKWLRIAERYSKLSDDPSTKVGCVITDTEDCMVSSGFNCMPYGCSCDESVWNDRPRKYKRVIHAEVSAILDAPVDIMGFNLYVWPTSSFIPICSRCASLICERRLGKVIWSYDPLVTAFDHWKDACSETIPMFTESGIEMVCIEMQ